MPLEIPVLGEGRFTTVWGRRDQRVAQIARAQHAVVSRKQLRTAGLSPSAIDRLARRGMLAARHPGVYVVETAAGDPLTELTAALLAAGPAAALDGLSAAWLWRILGPGASLPAPVEVIAPEPQRRRLSEVEVSRTKLLRPRHVRRRSGLPVLSPAWTVLRLASRTSERELQRAFDEARVQGLLRDRELEALLGEVGRVRGRAALRRLLKDSAATSLTRLEAEERFLALVRGGGLPAPAVNVRLHGYEVDFLWPAERVVVEVDGWRYHSSRSAFERDRRKSAVLAAHGYVVIRVTWRQITEAGGLAALASVAQALAVSAARA